MADISSNLGRYSTSSRLASSLLPSGWCSFRKVSFLSSRVLLCLTYRLFLLEEWDDPGEAPAIVCRGRLGIDTTEGALFAEELTE